MDRSPKSKAARVFWEVLEDFTFLCGEPVPIGQVPVFQGIGYLASLEFRGPVFGGLELGVPGRLAEEIAASTLGIDAEDPQARGVARDAVKEVVSVLGGHLAGMLVGPGLSVTLSPPELAVLTGPAWERLRADSGTLGFTVNDQPVLFRVHVQGEGVGS